MKTRTPCGELVWRSNMRRCRFEDGSRYCPSTCKWYFRFYQTSKSFQECWQIWLEKFKDRFSFCEYFFFSPQSCKEERKYKFTWKRQRKENCQLAKGLRKKKKTRAGMEKDECTVGNRLLHMQLASPPSLAWTEGPWTLPANYNWNLPSPTHSLHRMAGPKGWKLQNVNTETGIRWQI